MPISQGQTYKVYVPTIDYFVDRILNEDHFSYVKLSIEWWMLLGKAFTRNNLRVNQFKDGIPKNIVPLLAREMVNEWNQKQKMDRKYKTNVNVIQRILQMSINPKPKNLVLGVTDRCNVDNLTFPLPPRGSTMPNLIETVLPKGEIPLHALPFRIWAVSGEINSFLDKIKHKNIAIVGPSHLANFGYKLGFKNFNYINIHNSDAILHVHETKTHIQQLHQRLLKGHKDVTYFFIGGGAAMWLITELHGTLERANLIDIGRAFDVYYYYDPVMKKYPNWMFGQWLTKRNTAWVRNNLIKDKDGVLKVVRK